MDGVNEFIAGNGKPLLFLHGWGVGYDAYLPLLTKLASSYAVYAPDLPGFGKTPEPDTPWSADDYADFAAGYCVSRGLTDPVCIGHSNGGRVLLTLLSRENPGIRPPRMALFGPAGLKRRKSLRVRLTIALYKLGKLLLTPIPKLQGMFTAGKGSADYRSASPLMRETMKKLLDTDLTPRLRLVKAPTLLIWGENDTASPPADGRVMEKNIPDCGLALIPGGHWSFIEQLPRTMRILEAFLPDLRVT
ncbi:MAG: alpha/beta hydrolase [Oscillospiraceae bacterium]|nr:alpha/beta hydrolase [Oscillospiraceae bacterium]